jgi:hypothetical protein
MKRIWIAGLLKGLVWREAGALVVPDATIPDF